MGEIINLSEIRRNLVVYPTVSFWNVYEIAKSIVRDYEEELSGMFHIGDTNFNFQKIWFDQFGRVYFLDKKKNRKYKTIVVGERADYNYINFFNRLFKKKPSITKECNSKLNEFYQEKSEFFQYQSSKGPYNLSGIYNNCTAMFTFDSNKVVIECTGNCYLVNNLWMYGTIIFTCYYSIFNLPYGMENVGMKLKIERRIANRKIEEIDFSMEYFELLKAIFAMKMPVYDLPSTIRRRYVYG